MRAYIGEAEVTLEPLSALWLFWVAILMLMLVDVGAMALLSS